MRFSHFFVERPVFAAAISLFIVLIGALAFPLLPTAQFPQIVPPTVNVSASYPGATAETLAETVAAPLEESINGVEDALYLSSQSTGDGQMKLTVTFKLGTDLNVAQGLVQDRVNAALSRLPDQVQRSGVVVRKAAPDLLLGMHLYSPDQRYDRTYISNYFALNIEDRLLRTEGVGDLLIRGERQYAIRVWVDPARAAERGLSASDIVTGLRNANLQVSTGALNQAPGQGEGAYQIPIDGKAQLSTPEEFGDIVLKSDPSGALVRVRDVGRVELGAQDYTSNDFLSKDPALFVGVLKLPGANSIETEQQVLKLIDEVRADLPPGMKAEVIYNPTEFISESIKEVYKALFEAMVIVGLVVLIFLQSWRASIVPLLAIPVSLLGTLAVMYMAGFSLNNLSLFGLVLAIGIVVDDAIIVVENVDRLIEEGRSPREAAHETMDEVGSALIGIAFTLVAVFGPAALIPGITGEFFRQFALTIAVATLFSLLVSLTLSPAMAAVLLKAKPDNAEKSHEKRVRLRDWKSWRHLPAKGAHKFNQAFDWASHKYGSFAARTLRTMSIVLICYGVLLALTGWRIWATPAGFIPQQDQGNLIANVRMPEGTSLDKTTEVAREVVARILSVKGVKGTNMAAGFDATTSTPNSATAQIYIVLDPFAERSDTSVEQLVEQISTRIAEVPEAKTNVLRPPPVRGIGTAGGFKLIVEDRAKQGYEALAKKTDALVSKLKGEDGLKKVRTTFNTGTPRIAADIDRAKANSFGVGDADVFSTLQTYLASSYINDFTFEGRTYQVRVQADAPYRRTMGDAQALKVASRTGAMVPLGSVMTLDETTGPYRVLRYNLYPAAEVQGSTAPGTSSGEALSLVKSIADKVLGKDYGSEWTEIAYQQDEAGSIGYLAFVFAAIFAYLLLAALYESFLLPLAVLMIVPMCILAALVGVALRGLDNNILTQVGLVTLVGLAAKNTILIVEFAIQDRRKGESLDEAATHAARTRLRPILMTSFAFILGVIPLAFASGAGAELRQALGTAVFAGMIGVTLFGLAFTPAFYRLFAGLAEKHGKRGRQDCGEADRDDEHGEDENGDGDRAGKDARDAPRLPPPPERPALPGPEGA